VRAQDERERQLRERVCCKWKAKPPVKLLSIDWALTYTHTYQTIHYYNGTLCVCSRRQSKGKKQMQRQSPLTKLSQTTLCRSQLLSELAAAVMSETSTRTVRLLLGFSVFGLGLAWPGLVLIAFTFFICLFFACSGRARSFSLTGCHSPPLHLSSPTRARSLCLSHLTS